MKNIINKIKSKYEQIRSAVQIQRILFTVAEDERVVYKILLKNTAAYDNYSTRNGVSNKITIGITKKVIDRIFALKHLVSIQPMKGPVGLAWMLRCKHNEREDGPQLTLEIVQEPVMASSFAMKAMWNTELVQDLSAIHGIDGEKEICDVLSTEIAQESIAYTLHTINQLNIEESTTKEELLTFALNKAAAAIARRTRRGMGNVILTSPAGASILERQPQGFKFVRTGEEYNGTLTHVANLCEHDEQSSVRYTILVAETFSETVEFLVAYRGSSKTKTGTTVDAGYVFCPYVPVIFTGTVIDPATFVPGMKAYTRQAGVANGPNAGDYFYRVRLES